MAVIQWAIFLPLTLAAVLFVGTQVVTSLALDLPWALAGFFRGRLRLAGVLIQLATPAIWGCLAAVVVLASFFVFPQTLAFYASHTATKLGAAVGAFWLLVGLFSAGGKAERAELRSRTLQGFGK